MEFSIAERNLAVLRSAFAMLLGAGLFLSGCAVPSAPFGNASENQTTEVAKAAYSVGDFEEAARLYERSTESDPGQVDAYIGLGKTYTALRQFGRAENALKRAAELAPRNPDVHNSLGALALHRMHPAVALGHYETALRYDRRSLPGLTGAAVSLDYLSRHAEAGTYYQQGLQHYPTNFALLNNRALSLVLAGRIGEGTALLEELIRDADRGQTARTNMAIAYALDGRNREARAMLTGLFSNAEIDQAMAHYATLRRDYLAGKPIGHLAFQ